MPAYVVIFREEPVSSPEEMETYRRKGQANTERFSLTPLVVYGSMVPLEGEAPDGVVVLKFDTVEDAKGWYYSPGYQEAVPHRLKAAPHRAVIVEGV